MAVAVVPGVPERQSSPSVTTVSAAESEQGTTVFLEVDDSSVVVFSWEGQVRLTPAPEGGRQPPAVVLRGGEQATYRDGAWLPPRRLEPAEARERRLSSILLNGFTAPMATLPVIERELGLVERP